MRMITDLSPETVGLLLLIYKKSKHSRVRQRAHCIYLSSQGYSTTELMKVFTTTRLTIYNRFNAWESRRFAGLYDKPGKGRKYKLSPKQKERIREWAKEFPRRLSKVCALVCG